MACLCDCVARSARAVCRRCGGVLHSIYAVARNGLWDDPAEAVTGSIFKRFEEEAERVKLGKELAAYLTWRYCYLQCSALFAIVEHVITIDDLRPNATEYEVLFSRAPSGLQRERFETLFIWLSMWDVFLAGVWLVSFIILLAAIAAARPRFAVRRVALSRRLTWISWLVNFVVPFAIFMLFPVRSVVNWSGLEVDVCVVAVTATMNAQGVNVGGTMAVLQEQGVLTPGSEELALGGISSEDVVRKWCEESGSDWGNIFFNGAVQCVWSADSSCRETVCAGVPGNLQTACLSQCLTFSQQAGSSGSSTEATAFMQSLTPCTVPEDTSSSSGVFELPSIGGPQAGSAPPGSIPTVGGGGAGGGETEDDRAQMLQTLCGTTQTNVSTSQRVFNLTSTIQRQNTDQTWENAQMVISRLQYIVGLFIAMRAGQTLLSAALSVLGGLAEALMNMKALFPGAQEANWVLILTTMQGLPVYCALMAFVQQMVGDHWLAITCALFALFSSLSGVTAASSLLLRTSVEERWRFYRKVWVEYGFRLVLGVGALVSLRVFLQVNFPELRELLQLQNITRTLLVTLLSYLARKSLIAVAGTDAALSAFVQCELWHETATEAELTRQGESVRNLGCLLAPNLKRQASAAVREKSGNKQIAPVSGSSEAVEPGETVEAVEVVEPSNDAGASTAVSATSVSHSL